MELIDLINHVKANVEAGKKPEAGLLFKGRPSTSVALNIAEAYSLEKSAGEKLYDEWASQLVNGTALYARTTDSTKKQWQWLAEREQTLKAQADAWETVWDKLRDVSGPMFGLYTGTGTEVALKAIDDLVARAEGKIIHVKLPAQAMTGEQFYNDIWKGHFEYTMPWKSLNPEFTTACETAARLISTRKLTGQDIIDATMETVTGNTSNMLDYWDRVAEQLNAK